ncbi:thiosulfate:glutathione sulfurtransferase [Hypomesus transpacificus]|uniref:thiosulfate:glutathione sulfurtransferase n=1 Tax=Hypomesus transpacificus TaxID=137520 RepID=UPI001F079234|nr:thiosulfate:glutathione sulfurtransferase [Hypomesus transpacificus]
MLSYLLSRRTVIIAADTASRLSLGSCGHWLSFRTSTSKSGKPLIDSESVVSYEQLKNMLSNRNIQLFDVRNPDEYLAGRIPDAVNIPLGELEESLKLSPGHFKQTFQVPAPLKDDDNIVFHCKSGNRSVKALGIAYNLGFTRARHYKGGYSEWVEREGK